MGVREQQVADFFSISKHHLQGNETTTTTPVFVPVTHSNPAWLACEHMMGQSKQTENRSGHLEKPVGAREWKHARVRLS